MVKPNIRSGLNNLNIKNIDLINYNNKTLDITDTFIRIDITENLFTNFVSGSIIINDELNLRVSFPLIGNEKLRVRWQSSKNSTVRSYTFVITDIEYIKDVQEGIIEQMKLNFIDERYVTLISKPYYGFLEDQSLSTIVNNITKDYDVDITVDVETEIQNETINYNILHGSSVKALRNLRYKFSKPIVFYQQNDSLIMTTYDKLFQQTPIKCNVEIQMEEMNTDKSLKPNNFKKFAKEDIYDIIDLNLKGIKGYNNFVFNPFTDEFSNVEYKLSDYTGSTNAKYDFTSENFLNVRLNMDSRYIENYLLTDFMSSVMPYGSSDFKVGDLISVILRSNTEKSNISTYSGNALIVSLTHSIWRQSLEYKQEYTLIKREMFRSIF